MIITIINLNNNTQLYRQVRNIKTKVKRQTYIQNTINI